MTRARNISNPQAITLPLTVSANITSNASLAVGNTNINGTANITTSVNIGSNVSLSTSSLSVGNATVNTVVSGNSIVTVGHLHVKNDAYPSTLILNGDTGNVDDDGRIDAQVVFCGDGVANAETTLAGNNYNYGFRIGYKNLTGTGNLAFDWTTNSTALSILSLNSDGSSYFSGPVTFANSTANVVYVAANGNVGIGNNTPGVTLSLKGYDTAISFNGTRGSGAYHSIETSGTNNDALAIRANSAFYVSTNGGDRIMAAANGNVGISNSQPAYKLHVTGTAFTSGNTFLGGSSSLNSIGYLQEGHGSVTLGAGIRELFRVGSWSLSSSGFFSLAYTRGNVVHNSMWTWVVNHAGRVQLYQLGSATYTNSTIYADDNNYGSVIISVDHGAGTDQSVEYTVTTYVGALDMGNVNTQWTSNASSYYRVSRTTSGSSMSVPNMVVSGSLTKGSGTFDITHPLDDTKRLRHSFIEGPRYDLIYRGKAQLINGQAIVNIDTDAVSEGGQTMSDGTFTALTRNPSTWLQNETSWSRLKCTLNENILTINCEDELSTDTVSWMVVAERKDMHVLNESDQSDSEGRMILEYDPNAPKVLDVNYVYPADKVVSPGE